MSSLTALNLRVNPFGAPFRYERGRLAVPVLDMDVLAERLHAGRCAIQLMGKPGSGKTTHLAALHEFFPDMPLTTLPECGPLPPIAEAPVVFIDEAQRLSQPLRRELFRRDASFVLATHRSHARALRRAHFTVFDARLAGLGLPLLHRYVALRMEWARLGPGPTPCIPHDVLAALSRAHAGDVRAIEDALYEWLQREESLVVH